MLDANNLELLQTVFEKYDADKDGLMTKVDVTQVPAIAQMLVSLFYYLVGIASLYSATSMRIKLL